MNKRGVLIFLFLLFFPLCLFSQDNEIVYYQPPFLPFCVDVMGMGEAFTANSKGYSSLFYNPAGFAMGDYSLTLVTASPWIYTDPLTLFRLPGMSGSVKEETISSEILSGGYGNGIHAGIGFVKNGLGLGASFIMDSYFSAEDNINNMTGNVHMTLGFILGYAHAFTFNNIILSIGGDIRPMARVYVPVPNTLALDIFESYVVDGADLFGILGNTSALYGLGIGFDAGVIIQFGNFKCGLSVRDMGGTQFDFRESPFNEVMNSLADSGIFPQDGVRPDGVYKIPMNISTGVSYHPDLGSLSEIVDPQIHLDFKDIANVILEEKSLLLLPHLGLELALFDIVTIRGGFAEGYFSAGMGINVLFLDLNLAFFTRENGDFPGEIPGSSSVIELAVRLKL